MSDQPPVDEEPEPEAARAAEDEDEDEFHLANEEPPDQLMLQLDDDEERDGLVEEHDDVDGDHDEEEEEDERELEREGAAGGGGMLGLLRLLPPFVWQPEPDAESVASAMDAANAPDSVTFNRQLPGEHAYLGGDLEAPSSANSLASESASLAVRELPGLTCSLAVLLPGQLLPLALFHPNDVSLVAEMHAGRINQVALLHRYPYSSTAELLSCREEVDDNAGLAMVRAKLIGRQRFELLGVRRDITGRAWAKIRPLPESKQMSPCESRPGPRRSLDLAAYPFPAWVAEGYDARQLVTAIRAELAACNRSWAEVQAGPDEPGPFSYWLLEQLPLPDWLRADLLGCPHPAGCLRRCLPLLRRCAALRCVVCRNHVSNKSAIFCLAASGATGAYVNPGGHVHEMMTVAAATGVRPVGRPCAEHSWFPGYAWQILECNKCSRHMGWRFTAQSSDTRPAAFYGICRKSVEPDLAAVLDNLDQAELVAESVVSTRVMHRTDESDND